MRHDFILFSQLHKSACSAKRMHLCEFNCSKFPFMVIIADKAFLGSGRLEDSVVRMRLSFRSDSICLLPEALQDLVFGTL
jgi:hypothetical protein